MMSSSSSSSYSATVRVDKATSDLLIGPDWTMNIDICDSLNSNHGLAKDVVKAVKKRLQHKNPRVQLLSLTLLETMIKNCGEYVHFQIADRNILPEMIKIVKKKTDMQVRDKVLDLLDSWQEAFGGPGGKYPQYYWAYEELRRSGVEFPKRSRDAAPIFTPPVANTLMRHSQAGYGMPSNTSIRLDEAMASEMENLSLSNLDSMRSVLELLSDMLQAVNPNDTEAVKDEVIVDLVSQCRANQKKLMQMLTSTGDEDLLCQGLALNDNLQSLLVKHDAIASGSPLPTEVRDHSPRSTERRSSGPRSNEGREPSPRSNATPTSPLVVVTSNHLEEEDEEDDDFAKLARRQTKNRLMPHDSTSTGSGEDLGSSNVGNVSSSQLASAAATSSESNALALALPDPPNPVRTTKEQDMIDLLSITLSTSSISPQAPITPPSTSNDATSQAPVSSTTSQVPVSSTTDGYPYRQQAFPGYQGQVPFNNYVAPWAQPQPQPQPQPQSQPQPQPQSQPKLQPQFPQYPVSYPPPPWATASTANVNQIPSFGNSHQPFLALPANNTSASYMPTNVGRPLQDYTSFPVRGNNSMGVYGEQQRHSTTQQHVGSATGPKPFIPSYRLFEDLNVLGNPDGGHKTTTNSSPSLSGMTGQSMVGGRK